jgi:5-methylcytosine-specific restriction endonuclease McrA
MGWGGRGITDSLGNRLAHSFPNRLNDCATYIVQCKQSTTISRKQTTMKLKDYLYVETDDACAICGIKGINILTIHHIDGNHANNIYENTIILCSNCHQKHHTNKGLSTKQIKNRKQHLVQKTLTQYGLNALKIANRNSFGVVAMPFLLYHLVDLDFMTKEEAVMGYGSQQDATAKFAITDRGVTLLKTYFT